METQEQIHEQQYLKGINHGYLLAIHEPDLATKIVSHKNDRNEYFKGLVSCKQEHDMEKIRERLKGVTRNESPAKDVDKKKEERSLIKEYHYVRCTFVEYLSVKWEL